MFKEWLNNFVWESQVQEQGFGAFIQWFRRLPTAAQLGNGKHNFIFCVIAWFIQKDHESNEWWRDTVAEQMSTLQEEIIRLRDEIIQLKKGG